MLVQITTYVSENQINPAKRWMAFIEVQAQRWGIMFNGETEEEARAKAQEYWDRGKFPYSISGEDEVAEAREKIKHVQVAGRAGRGGVVHQVREWVKANPDATKQDVLKHFSELNPSTVMIQFRKVKKGEV